ncbi:MAG TPA: glutamate mutase L [Flexilinea sp.]|nr:glutamate mutase L [Flexilinea sp.]HOG22061.1 glutamate mutase L [Flexilinea sp.]HOU19615.1 glutamate mutase L [Flexilinea sp.]HQF80160.1 glutamate mutase L [Flexilinea sp.]HQG89038.1 glutamate mutase L [Flexilinea sp.]
MNRNQDIHTVLYVDIGSVNTRVCLFDRMDDQYSFIGAASATTSGDITNQFEYLNVIQAVEKLEHATKRKILDRNQNIVMPATLDHSGIDQVAVSYTCIPDPRIAVMGLTHAGSLQNVYDLLSKVGVKPVAEICAEDGKTVCENLDLFLHTAPRIVIVSGGTEQGAEIGIYRLGEILMLACRSLPKEQRPIILYAGNSAAKKQMERVFSQITDISFSTNVLESGSGVQPTLNGLINVLRKDLESRAPGFRILREKTKCSVIPGEFAFGRTIRLMSRLIRQNRHILGIDIGAHQTILADAVNLALSLHTLPLGIGNNIGNLLNEYTPSDLQSWISFQIKSAEIQDYILNKSYYPDLIPANKYSAEIELALARAIVMKGIENESLSAMLSDGSLAMVFLSGAVLRNVEDPGEALMFAMDSLAPVGMVDYLLDMNGLSGAIGTLAHLNPVLASQIMSTSAYLNLGKVIRPSVRGEPPGKSIMTVSVRDDAGNTRKYDIPFNRIYRIPLEYGKNYELEWTKISHNVTVPGVKTWAPAGFKSGCFGLVFDTREEKDGKIKLPKEKAARDKKLQSWRTELGPWLVKQEEESHA